MNKIEQQIEENYTLQNEIEQILISIIIRDDNKRDILLVGFFRTALCHYQAITVLIEQGLYHSALALIRVLFDSIIRGLYMYNTFDEEKIEKLYHSENWEDKDFFKSKTKIMCEEVDKKYGELYGKLSFEKTRKKIYSSMCDYTHTGFEQIARNFNNMKSTIEPNFSEDLIIATLIDSNILINVFSAMCLDQLKIDVMENDDE